MWLVRHFIPSLSRSIVLQGRPRGKEPLNVLSGMSLHQNFLTETEECDVLEQLQALLTSAHEGTFGGTATYVKPPISAGGIGRNSLQFGCAFEHGSGLKPEVAAAFRSHTKFHTFKSGISATFKSI